MATAVPDIVQKLYIESNIDQPELLELNTGRVIALCRPCPDRDSPNDDSAAVVQTGDGAIVMIVADGVGGGPVGHKASAIAVRSVAKSIRAAEPLDDLRPAILDGIERANEDILKMGIGAATTLAAVEIQDRTTRAYQVGDSLSLVIGQRGALKWKSTMHSPVGYAIESGMLDEDEAMHHDERHVVSNLVGSRTMHIEIGPNCPLAARDTVIVASDGLYDNLHLDEIISLGRRGDPRERMTALTELAATRMSQEDSTQPGKPDDLTILVYVP